MRRAQQPWYKNPIKCSALNPLKHLSYRCIRNRRALITLVKSNPALLHTDRVRTQSVTQRWKNPACTHTGSRGSEQWSNQTTGGKQQAIESRTNKRIRSQSKPTLPVYTETSIIRRDRERDLVMDHTSGTTIYLDHLAVIVKFYTGFDIRLNCWTLAVMFNYISVALQYIFLQISDYKLNLCHFFFQPMTNSINQSLPV